MTRLKTRLSFETETNVVDQVLYQNNVNVEEQQV